MSDPKKPVFDERALGKLLEAAFVIQENTAELQKKPALKTKSEAESEAESRTESKEQKPLPAAPISAGPISEAGISAKENPDAKFSSSKTSHTKTSAPVSESVVSPKTPGAAPAPQDAYTLTLARIVETQQQILARGLELASAMALVAQHAAEITRASGSAIGILESKPAGKILQYRAVSGRLTLARGSEVAVEKALSFNCLRAGEAMRCADVNSDFLLDAEECRRRGIGSLIAVPIYRDSGIAGALELYFASPNTFTEQDVHSCQLMAGLITEALARDAGVSSRKSLAAERATMLDALEKLRPNLAALMQSAVAAGSVAKNAPPAPAETKTAAAGSSKAAAGSPIPAVSVARASLPDVPAASIPRKENAPAFLCRRCGHELVGEEMFCGKCGSPRTSEYQPPTMQSKLAALWQKQQALKPSAVPGLANGSANGAAHPGGRQTEPKNHPPFPAEIQPWEAVLSELTDPFAEAEPELHKPDPARKPALREESEEQLRKEAIEISSAAKKFATALGTAPEESVMESAPVEISSTQRSRTAHAPIEQELLRPHASAQDWEANLHAGAAEVGAEANEKQEYVDEADAEEAATGAAPTTAFAGAYPLAWSSAAKAKEAFERLAAGRNQNSFVRFWNARRGDVYLAVAVVLVAGVVRWSIASEHSFGGNRSAAAKTSHRRPAADADLSTFDKFLISVGLAEAPDPPEDKGNPDTQVWVDLHSALYYCPGADLYGKTPQGKYTTQQDAQLGQFEPAYRKACQ
ncbi:MAG TPA: GAF domain-containing protein [Candidatus Sulfotelmatobacter sp.]